MCLANGLDFPNLPNELKDLSPLEERLVSPRLPFMQIRSLGAEKQSFLKGNVVNVENDLDKCAQVLPRTFEESSTVQVMLMRRMSYTKPYMYETIRPKRVFDAARKLISSSLYLKHRIVLCEDWCKHSGGDWGTFSLGDQLEFLCDERDRQHVEEVIQNQSDSAFNDEIDTETSVNENVTEDESRTTLTNEQETPNAFDQAGAYETLFFSENNNPLQGIKIAPAEGKIPRALYLDDDAEVLSFPTVYGGHARKIKKGVKMTYTDIAKSEIRRYDRRACKPAKLLYSFKKSFNEKVYQALQVCLRMKVGAVTAGNARNPAFMESLIRKDDGYNVYKHIRSSPAYWKDMTKKVCSMIRQIGNCSFFITFSAAETRWTELLVILKQILKDQTITEAEAKELSFDEVSDLIRSDPVTCSRHFEHKFRQLMNILMKKAGGVFSPYALDDYFTRVEYQMRGSPHSHGLYWIKNAPQYDPKNPASVQECIQFINQYITCSREETQEMEEVMGFQLHKHSKTCEKKRKGECRFGYPKPPLPSTIVLDPLPNDIDVHSRESFKEMWKLVRQQLTEWGRSFKEDIDFEEFLQNLNLSFEDYILAVRSTIKRTTVFFRRSTNAAFINAYNKKLLLAWRANMDIQFVLDSYACAKYCVGYILKSEGGVSKLLQELTKQAKRGDLSGRRKLLDFANILVNGSEISAQEAAAFLLGLPNSQCSRLAVYINTAPPNERYGILKSSKELETLDDNDEDVCEKGLIDHYKQRPEELESCTLADFAAKWEFKKSNLTAQTAPPTTAIRVYCENGYYQERKKLKIIRYRHYGKHQDPTNYSREQLMLFLPWRNEEVELLRINPIQKLEDSKETVYQNSTDYIQNRDIDDIMQDLLYSRGAEEEENNSNATNTSFAVTPEENEQFTFEEFTASKSTMERFLIPKAIPQEDYLQLMRQLNVKQREFVMNALHLFKTSRDPFNFFLTGGAGVGKSHAITAIVQSCIRYDLKFPTTNPDQCCVLVAAPTGKAAFNVFGMTLHCTFKLPPNQAPGSVLPLESGVLNTLRCQLQRVRLFIIDEVSMVSVKHLYDIDHRLRQVYATNEDFGGRSMIVVGHLRQLRPVLARYVFDDPVHLPLGSVVGNYLWNKYSMYELDEIMRQKGDFAFCKALNNMSEGTMDEEDIKLIRSREITSSNRPPDNAIRLFATNDECKAYNAEIHKKLGTEGARSIARDRVEGYGTDNTKNELKDKAKTLTVQQSDGLLFETNLQVGAVYFVSTNIDVQDGIFNGSTGTLMKIDYGYKPDGERIPIRAWLDFNNPLIGNSTRSNYRNLMKQKNIPSHWVPIERLSRKLKCNFKSFPGLTIIRNQIPLTAANGMTIKKAQGSTLPSVVVCVKPNQYRRRKLSRELLYVGCSRATCLNGLYIDGTFEAPNPPTENDAVSAALENMKAKGFSLSIPSFLKMNDDKVKLYFHNIQSLYAHWKDLEADACAMASDYILLVEPHLLESDNIHVKDYHFLYRSPCSSTRNSEGAAILVKKQKPDDKILRVYKKNNSNSHVIIVHSLLANKNVLLIYRHPKFSLAEFYYLLKHAIQECQGGIIMVGDINIDVMDGKRRGFHLEFMAQYNLATKLPANMPTTDYGTQIDCCFTNDVNIKAEIYESYYSYHKPICVSWE